MGEAQEIEGLRLALSPCRPVGRGMPAEFNQAGFIGVQFQGKLRHSGAYRLQEPFGIGPVLETNDRVVGVAHHDHGAARMAFAPLLGPEIVDVMEIDVRQQRRYDRPLRGAFIAGRLTPSSTTPAFSHLRIRRSTRWSPIRCSTNRIIHSWLMLSKNPRMSASSIQFTDRCSMPTTSASSASCWPRPGRNP